MKQMFLDAYRYPPQVTLDDPHLWERYQYLKSLAIEGKPMPINVEFKEKVAA